MEKDEAREPVMKDVRLLVPIEKAAARERITYGVVLEPDTEDLQGDVMTAEDIEKAAYGWMERSQQGGQMHASLVEGATVVESYIAPCDIPVETAAGTETIKKGSWILAMRWPEEVWESIEKGDLTGYSVGGTGVRLEIEKHGSHDQREHGNWARGRFGGDPARDGAAAAGGGTPADQGAAAARRDAAQAGTGGTHKVGDSVRLKEDGTTGKIVDYQRDKHGGPGEYAIALDNAEPGGPKAIWVREDELIGDDDVNTYAQFKPHQKVRDVYGKEHKVLFQRGSQVFLEDGGWAHPTKIWPIKKSDEDQTLEDAIRAGLRDAIMKAGRWAPGPNANWRRASDDEGALTGYGADRSTPRLDAWHRSQMASTPEERREAAAEYERLADQEDAATAEGGGKKHITRDGIAIEDQPKVQRLGGEAFASADGRVQVNYGEWKWLGAQGHGAKNPKLHERGRFGVWPRGADRSDPGNVIWSSGKTLAEFINSLDPGEYDLAT